jgi:hypothetical protein
MSMYPLIISTEGVVTKAFVKCLQNTGLTETMLREVPIAVLLHTCHAVRKFLATSLILGVTMNFRHPD